MKKILLIAVLAVMSLAANAQMYVGGEAGFWREWQDGQNYTSLRVKPEVGYNLNENWAIGVALGYSHVYNEGTKFNVISASPYARYTFAKLGNVNFFADGAFDFVTVKAKGSDATNAFGIGIKPGLSVAISDKISFVSHFGFLGYRDSKDFATGAILGGNGLGFDLDGNSLTFGLYFNF